jgi:hypothetical protein
MAEIYQRKELEAVAKKIKTLAIARAPRKTGNLKQRLASYNQPTGNMITNKGDGRATLSFDAGPPGALYGQYWNSPAGPKSRTKHRKEFGFADKAFADVDKELDEYVKAVEAQIVKDLLAEINKL